MPRKGRTWASMDVNFTDDPLIEAVGERAGWLFMSMIFRCKALPTDGVLTRRQVEKLGISGWELRLEKLLTTTVGDDPTTLVWPGARPDTYFIVNWFAWNEPVQVLQARRAADAERKRAGGGRSPVDDSGGIPSGVVPDSTRRESKREKESRGSGRTPSAAAVDNPCGHGAAAGSCALCRRASLAAVPASRSVVEVQAGI